MAKFECPNCGEPVSTRDRVDDKIAACQSCRGRVLIPESPGVDQDDLPATSPLPPPHPSGNAKSTSPTSLNESFSAGDLGIVAWVGAAVVVAIGIWLWGGWALLFQAGLWLVVAVSGILLCNFSEQLRKYRREGDHDSDAHDQCLGLVILTGGVAAASLLTGAFVFQGVFIVVSVLIILGIAIYLLDHSGADFRFLVPLALCSMMVWRTGIASKVYRWLYPRPVEVRRPMKNFGPARRDVATPRLRAEVPTLGSDATIQQISDAYRPHFYFVRTNYVAHKTRLFGTKSEDGGMFGSGVLIANDKSTGLIVTNRHVIDPNRFFGVRDGVRYTDIEVYIKGRQNADFVQARVVATHKNLDIAILIIERPFSKHLALRTLKSDSIALGQPVVSFGNPNGVGYRVRDGEVASEVSDEHYIDHGCTLDPGFSGGPLVNKAGGELIGINTFGIGKGGNYAILADSFVSSLHDIQQSAQSIFQSSTSDPNWVWLDNSGFTAAQSRQTARRLAELVEFAD